MAAKKITAKELAAKFPGAKCTKNPRNSTFICSTKGETKAAAKPKAKAAKPKKELTPAQKAARTRKRNKAKAAKAAK